MLFLLLLLLIINFPYSNNEEEKQWVKLTVLTLTVIAAIFFLSKTKSLHFLII